MLELTTKEAVLHILNTKNITKYALAQSLKLAPASINQYLRRTRMSEQTALMVSLKYNILIIDVYVR